MSHVTIIGSGIAAIAAAIEASERGASITLIKGRPGATALSSGAWDIAGLPGRYSGLRWHEFPSASDNLRELIRRKPSHPYSLMARNEPIGPLTDFLAKSIQRLSSLLEIRLRGSLESNMAVLHPLGGLKITSFVQQHQSAGNFSEMRRARLLVVGFKGLPSFFAPEVVSLLKHMHQTQDFQYLEDMTALELSLKSLPSALLPIDLARRLDEEEVAQEFLTVMKREIQRHKATHVVFAPVIGVTKGMALLTHLMEVTGCAAFEALGLPPSVPGLRLLKSIESFLETKKSAWKIVEGSVESAQTQNGRVHEITLGQGKNQESFKVDHLILATGRYLGGGIVKEKSFREPLLDLPLFSNGSEVKEVFTGRLVSKKFLAEQDLFSVGVRTNQHLQPLDARGRLLYGNVWVAGSLLGGYNSATEHCGMGVAVGTGTLAGRVSA